MQAGTRRGLGCYHGPPSTGTRMSSSLISAGPTSPNETAVLRWTVHPAAQERGKAGVVSAIVAVAGLLAFAASGSALLALLGVLFLLGSLRAFYLPRTYVLDGQGAREEGPLARPRRLSWSEVRRVTRARNGLQLSPLFSESRWRAEDGLFLRTAGNEERVAAFVAARAEVGAA